MPNSVLATRFNNLQNRIRTVLGTSLSSNPQFGYGQSYSSSTVTGDYDVNTVNTDLISPQEYETLYRDIIRARVHQIGGTFSQLSTPVGNFDLNGTNADKIEETYITYLENVMTSIEQDKFEIDSSQYSVIPLTDINNNSIDVERPEAQGSWNGILSHIFKVTFNTAQQRRHFFNAGGQIRLDAGLTWAFSQSKTNDWKNLLSGMGSVRFSASGCDSSLGVGSPTSIGNYQLTSSYQLVYRQSGALYSGSYYEVYALELSSNEIQFRIYFKDTSTENIDEDVFGTLFNNIKIAVPSGSVNIGGTPTDTVVITDLPVGQNVAVFNGVALPNPPTISAYWQPSTVNTGVAQTVYWTTTNSTSVNYYITNPDGTIDSGTGLSTSGNRSYTWSTAGTSSARLTAIGPGGSAITTVTGTVQVPVVVPTYSITPSATSQNEGATITFVVDTTKVNTGTTLYWALAPISGNIIAADFTDNKNQGSVQITGSYNAGTANIPRTLTNDTFTESTTEQYQIHLYTDSSYTNKVAESATVTINDTSQSPEVWNFTSSTNHPSFNNVINEGVYTHTINITTSNVAQGTTFYWTTTGTASSADFTDNKTSGTGTINSSGTASIVRNATADYITEGSESYTISIWRNGYNSGLLKSVDPIGIADTTVTPPALNARFDSSNITSSVQLGDSVTASWTTTNATDVDVVINYPDGSFDNSLTSRPADGSVTISTSGKGLGTLSVDLTANRSDPNGSDANTSLSTSVVDVPPPPTGSIYFSPSSMYPADANAKTSYPDSSTLFWSSSNATSVSVTLDGSAISSSASGSYGPITSNSNGTINALLSLSGAGGSTNIPATLTVNTAVPNPSITTLSVTPSNPTIVYTGDNVTVAWNTSNADTATMNGPGFSTDESVATSGSRSVTSNSSGSASWALIAENIRNADSRGVSKTFTQPITQATWTLSVSPTTVNFNGSVSDQFTFTVTGPPGGTANWSWSYDRGPYSGSGSLTLDSNGSFSSTGVHTDYGNFTNTLSNLSPDAYSQGSLTTGLTVNPPVNWSIVTDKTSYAVSGIVQFTINGPPLTAFSTSAVGSSTTNASGIGFQSASYNTRGNKTVTLSSGGTVRDSVGFTVYQPAALTVSMPSTASIGGSITGTWSISGEGDETGLVTLKNPNGQTIGSDRITTSTRNGSIQVGNVQPGTYTMEGSASGAYSSDSDADSTSVGYQMSMSISPSLFEVGDTYTVQITGGAPYDTITYNTSGTLIPSGGAWTAGSGTIQLDANGNWSLSGAHTGQVDFTYSASSSNSGSTSASAVCANRPTASINWSGTATNIGGTATASWSSSNATSVYVSLTGPNGVLYTSTSSSGSRAVTCNNYGIYTATCTASNSYYPASPDVASDTFDLAYVAPAPSGLINFDANSYTEGDSAVATWSTSNTTTTVTAYMYRDVNTLVASGNGTSGQLVFDTAGYPGETLTAVLAHGTSTLDTDSATITAAPADPFITFTPSTGTKNSTTFTLSWGQNGPTPASTSVTYVGPNSGSGTISSANSGSVSQTLGQSGTWTATITSDGISKSASATVNEPSNINATSLTRSPIAANASAIGENIYFEFATQPSNANGSWSFSQGSGVGFVSITISSGSATDNVVEVQATVQVVGFPNQYRYVVGTWTNADGSTLSTIAIINWQGSGIPLSEDDSEDDSET